MKTRKLLALLVGVLVLSGCVNPNDSTPVNQSEEQFLATSIDVVKSTCANNDEVKIEGVVYGVTTNGFFVADSASAGIFVNMGDNWNATVKIGSKVQVEAKYSLVSGYCALKQASVKVIAEGEDVPVTSVEKPFTFVNELVASPSGDYGMLVKLVGTLTQEGSNYVLTDDEGNTLNFASVSAAHLATLVNTRITLEAVVYKTDLNGKWQMVFAGDEDDIIDSTLSFADYLELAKADIAKKVPETCTGNLVLPAAHSIDSTLTYTWAVKSGTSVTIVENQAVVVPPTADEEVVLTVTITKGENTETVEVPVLSKAVVEKTVAQFMSELPLSGDAVKVNGVVVAMGRNQGSTSEPYAASKRYVVVQDETTNDAVPVNYYYSKNDYGFDGLSIGDKVTVEGNWSQTNGTNDNPTIQAKSVVLVSENATVVDAKKTATVIATKEQYEDLIENPDNYVGKLLKFDNPYLQYSTSGEPNPSNWLKLGYDNKVDKIDERNLAVLIGLGNENIDLGWNKHFDVAYSGKDAPQFAGDIYAYLVYRSSSYLQLCIPSVSYIAYESADAQAAYEQVLALPDSIDSEGQLALNPDVTYTFSDPIIGADGKVGVALANTDVTVTVTKGEVSFTHTISVISTTTYALEVGTETNGATTLSKTSQLLENEEVTATFAPAQGYVTVSYTLTTENGSISYPAYNQTSATFPVTGNATVTAKYDLAANYTTHTFTPYGTAGNVIWYNAETGAWTSGTKGDTARTYNYVTEKFDANFISDLFTLSLDPLSTGKGLNTRAQSDDYKDGDGNKLNLYCVYGAADDAAKLTIANKHEICSVNIDYVATAHFDRSTVYSGETVVKGVRVGKTNTYSYLVDSGSFSIENASGSQYLYIKSIEMVYAAPAAHEYQYDAEGHWIDCAACDGMAKVAHEVENGKCVCGYATVQTTLVGTTDLYALYKELYGTDFVKKANDKGLIPNNTQTFNWLGVEGDVQLRTSDAAPKMEILKNETGALTYTATGKVRITAQIASTSKTNSSSFALKAGDSYIACDQDATAIAGTTTTAIIDDKETTIIAGPDGASPIAATLYEFAGLDNVYMIYGSGDGLVLTWTVDASAVEGGLKLALTSPDVDLERGVRVLAVTIETIG